MGGVQLADGVKGMQVAALNEPSERVRRCQLLRNG